MSGPCLRCGAEGTHVVFETSGGSVTGPNGAPGSGPLTGRLYACHKHAAATYGPDEPRPSLARAEAVTQALCAAGLLAALALIALPPR